MDRRIFKSIAVVMRDTDFCPVYCIGAPSILFLQQYVLIYCFWGFRPNFPIISRIFLFFWSILKDYPKILVNLGKFWCKFDKKKTLDLCLVIDQNNTLGSLVNGNLAKIVGWTIKKFLIWWCHFYDNLYCFGFNLDTAKRKIIL